MKKTIRLSALCLCLLLTACNSQGDDAKKEKASGSTSSEKSIPTAAITAPKQAAPVAEAPKGNMPQASPKQGEIIPGKVLETMDAAGYTYLLVDTGKARQWVAIPEFKVNTGDEISYYDGMVMPNFTSKSLNRTFESVIFSPGLVGQTAPSPGITGSPMAKGAPDPHHGQIPAPTDAGKTASSTAFAEAVKAEGPSATMQAKMESGGSQGAIAPFSEVKVDKAAGENGHTVAELFAGNTTLDGKTVRVQGKVVKFSPMIMGKNWIHLQDGTGDPLKNTHDLVITTSAEPPKDKEIITIEGIVRANKDFGAGYSYVVLVEEAKIVQ